MNLDDINQIKAIDLQNVLGSADELSKQVEDAYTEASKVDVPQNYKDIDNIVMCGMGGSGLGARVIESVYGPELRYPLTRVNDYHLPEYVSERSLVVCSSYSGETEETIQNAREAIEKNAKWMAIGTGNSLIRMAQESNAPYYQINPKFNPSEQPRMAIGYSIVGQLVLASKAGVLNLNEELLSKVVVEMEDVKKRNEQSVPSSDNGAKKLGQLIQNKIILFFSSIMIFIVYYKTEISTRIQGYFLQPPLLLPLPQLQGLAQHHPLARALQSQGQRQ